MDKNYIGIKCKRPIYQETIKTIQITSDNISDYFNIDNGTYYFSGKESVFTSNNKGVNSSTAITSLAPLYEISEVSFNYSYSSESGYDKFTITRSNTTIVDSVSGIGGSTYTGTNLKKYEQFIFKYIKDGAAHSNDDICTFSNMIIKAKIPEIIGYEEEKEIAKKISKWYVSRGGVAKNVLKGYIGVNNIAKPLFEQKYELSYYGTATNLDYGATALAATTVGNYALFGGGYLTDIINAYDINLIKQQAPIRLDKARYNLAATTVGNYALFGGGCNYSDTKLGYNTVDAYDNNLIKIISVTNLSHTIYYLTATTVGNYALFGGGYHYDSGSQYFKIVYTYDNNLVRGTATALSDGRSNLAATTVGNYALFGGGYGTGQYFKIVDTYDNNLVKGTATSLRIARSDLAATTVGNYALFGGGKDSDSSNYATIDTYDNNLVRGTATSLSIARSNLAATTVGNYALFGGGDGTGNNAAVVTYDNNLVKGTTKDLSEGRSNLAATTVGNYALFGGGSKVVDVYQYKLT